MISEYRINPIATDLTWQTLITRIDSGYELQEYKKAELTKEEIVKFNDSIILDPDYQREYRSTINEESSFVESVLLGIPIPPIFLSSHKYNNVPVLNVIDGQHRLRALYRYMNNKFALKDLKILTEYNGIKYKDLEIDEINIIQSSNISTFTFRNFPGKNFELELFSRYNKGTKPLTSQEIRHAVYSSKINQYVNSFCKKLLNTKEEKLSKIYSISKDRYQKKTVQENIFIMLGIIENGIVQKYSFENSTEKKLAKSPQYAEKYMEEKYLLQKNNPEEFEKNYVKTIQNFEYFNKMLLHFTDYTNYPFSREIYGITSKGNKFQVSISMIISAIFHKVISIHDLNTIESKFDELYISLNSLLKDSYLEDPNYNASTTNPVEIEKLINKFEI